MRKVEKKSYVANLIITEEECTQQETEVINNFPVQVKEFQQAHETT